MTQQEPTSKLPRRLTVRLIAAATTLLCLGLLAATSASAAYEQAANFAGTPGVLKNEHKIEKGEEEPWPEEAQLGGVGGMAVNHTGAGGVPKGTVYAASYLGPPGPSDLWVAMYEPSAGGLKFSEAWQVTALGGPYQRCGPAGELPDGETLHPSCPSRAGAEASTGRVDVDVDQATGNVYALYGEISNANAGALVVAEYSADGGEEITRFGERAVGSETVATSPEKLHSGNYQGGLAVGPGGRVYVFDEKAGGEQYQRLAVFEPQSPGDYAHYKYAGEVAAGLSGEGKPPFSPVTDNEGNVYVAEGTYIQKYAPEAPAPYHSHTSVPICEFNSAVGGIQAITVDPESGDVFYTSYKERDTVHQLSGECGAGGKFLETSKFHYAPRRTEVTGLAFDPVRQLGPGRPAGTLYAGSTSGIGGKSEGTFPEVSNESSIGYIFARPALALPPKVESESVSHVTATTAEVGAVINPGSSASRYAFEYETEVAYEANPPSERFAGATEAPPGGAVLGEGTKGVPVSASLAGLSPDTTYLYRALASSHCSFEEPEKVCEGSGEAQAFHTFPTEAPGLPDRRAWELVSPANKNGGQVLPADPEVKSCPTACKPGFLNTHFPMQSAPDGEAVVYEGTPFTADEGQVNQDEYIARRDPNTGWGTTNLTPSLMGGFAQQGYKAFSTDLSRGVLFQISPALSPEAPSEFANLYTQSSADPLGLGALLSEEPPNRPAGGNGQFSIRYAGASADLSRVFFEANDALTEETPFAPEALDGGAGKFNLYEWDQASGRLALVNVAPGNATTTPGASFGTISAHAVSADGSRAFWSDESGQVYVRIDGESTKEVETEGVPDPGKFLAAAVDGSRVLLANGHLHDLGGEETTTDLTEGQGGFQGVVGQSEDLSRVYFVDTAVLTGEEENDHGAKAQATKFNLYAWSEGATRYVATLVANDNTNGVGDWAPSPMGRTAEASPDGSFLAFVSEAALTDYDNTGPCAGNQPAGEILPGPCAEAFLYDSATATLTCASCNPSLERPLGRSFLRLIKGGSSQQPRYLTDEGRLYFDSRDSLVATDTNNGVEDVYQYEPNEVGTCKREGGCTTLISSGTGVSDSNFLAMDESGKNVFFTTREQLVLKDKDELIDLYDAREDGGIASETEVARGECQGEACQPPVSAPNDPTPGSSTFEGAGNVDEKKAAKKKAHKKHAKKHKGKGHAKKHKRAANNNRGGAK